MFYWRLEEDVVFQKWKSFEIWVCRLLENWIGFFFLILEFPGEFWRKVKVTRKIQLLFICVCKYLNQRVRRIGEKNGKSFKGVLKTKKKKNTWRDWVSELDSRLSFSYCLPVLGKCSEKYLIYLKRKQSLATFITLRFF